MLRPALAALSLAAWSAAASAQPPDLLQRDEWGGSLQVGHAVRPVGEERARRSFVAAALRYSTPMSRFDWWPLGGRWRLGLEPGAGFFHQPRGGAIVGLQLAPRCYLLSSGRILPFLSAGAGLLYTSFRGFESNFNFVLTAGAGFDVPLSERVSLQGEYRFHHISNAGIKPPNGGTDSQLGSIGLSWWIGR